MAGPVALRIAIAADAGTFVACSLLLTLLVHIPIRRPAASSPAAAWPRRKSFPTGLSWR